MQHKGGGGWCGSEVYATLYFVNTNSWALPPSVPPFLMSTPGDALPALGFEVLRC